MDDMHAAQNDADKKIPQASDMTQTEWAVLQKLRLARKLAADGHRSRLEVMFYDSGRSCDITIEDRERVVDRLRSRDTENR